MKPDNRRGFFGVLSALLFLYAALILLSCLLNAGAGPEVLSAFDLQWRNDGAHALVSGVYRQLLPFIIPGAGIALAALIFSIKDYKRTGHESSLCMIIAACLMMVLNVIPGIYIGMFDHVMALNFYNVLMYTGPFSPEKLYPLYAVLLFIAAAWIFRTVYRFRSPREEEKAEA